MSILQIYVSDEDMATLRMIALERECAAADLAEAAVSEACLAVRREGRPRAALAQLDLAGIDRGLMTVAEAMQVGFAMPPPKPRCSSGEISGLGECLVCNSESGEACRRPMVKP